MRAGCRVLGLGSGIDGVGFTVKGSGFGFRVDGLKFMVKYARLGIERDTLSWYKSNKESPKTKSQKGAKKPRKSSKQEIVSKNSSSTDTSHQIKPTAIELTWHT